MEKTRLWSSRTALRPIWTFKIKAFASPIGKTRCSVPLPIPIVFFLPSPWCPGCLAPCLHRVIRAALWRLPPFTYIVKAKRRLCTCHSYCNSQKSLSFLSRCYPEEMFRSNGCTGKSCLVTCCGMRFFKWNSPEWVDFLYIFVFYPLVYAEVLMERFLASEYLLVCTLFLFLSPN